MEKILMDKSKSKRIIFVSIVALAVILSIVYTVMATLMYANDYDPALDLAQKSATLRLYITGAVCAIIIVAAGLALPLPKKQGKLKTNAGGITLLSALCGFFLLATVIMQIIVRFNGSLDSELGKYGTSLHSLALVFAVPASFYFLYSIFADKEMPKLRVSLGFFAVAWAIVCLVVTHLYLEVPINSPVRTGSILSFGAILLFIVEELRFYIGKPLTKLYCTLGLIALVFTLGDSIPFILLALLSKNSFGMNLSTIYSCFELSIGLYAVIRVLSFIPEKEKPEEDSAVEEAKNAPEEKTEE